MITPALNNIFEREHTLSLDRLKEISRRDARQFLRDLPEIHPFVEAYVMMFAFGGHTFPIDDPMLEMLEEEEVVEENDEPVGCAEICRASSQGRRMLRPVPRDAAAKRLKKAKGRRKPKRDWLVVSS